MELTIEQRIKHLERLVSALISPDPSGAIRREQRAIDAESNPPVTRESIAARLAAEDAAKAARS
jgi:hypothetical protein